MTHIAEIISKDPCRPFIDVRGGRYMVARLVPQGDGFRMQPAQNWAELEEEAARSVREAGGYLLTAGLYPCPPELARQGEWPRELLASWPDDLLTLAQASRISGVFLKTLHDAVRRGAIRSYQNEYAPGPRHGRTLVSLADVLERWGKKDNRQGRAISNEQSE